MELEQFFLAHPVVAVAFSGGVDSAYLLYAAKQYARKVKAYYVKTPFQPQFELDDAVSLANALSAELEILTADVLSQPEVASNPADRCYHCKRMLFSRILSAAAADGFLCLLDGTNASDDAGDRPGMRALQELRVLSPLRLCGLTKAQIRSLSKDAGLFTHDKPAYACLATRIPTGVAITPEMLQRTESAETYLSSLGLRNFRVRMLGNGARIQLTADDLPIIVQHREAVVRELKKYYGSVLLDLEVRHEQ